MTKDIYLIEMGITDEEIEIIAECKDTYLKLLYLVSSSFKRINKEKEMNDIFRTLNSISNYQQKQLYLFIKYLHQFQQISISLMNYIGLTSVISQFFDYDNINIKPDKLLYNHIKNISKQDNYDINSNDKKITYLKYPEKIKIKNKVFKNNIISRNIKYRRNY